MFGLNLSAQSDTLGSELLKIVVDKGVLALLVIIVGFFVSQKLESIRGAVGRENALVASEAAANNELRKLKANIKLQFLEKQLSEFFWPVLLRIEKDGSIWPRLATLSNAPDVLPMSLSVEIEKSYLLPNHQEIVQIIETKIHLVQDEKLIELLHLYMRHVAIYLALRSTKTPQNPISAKVPFPDELPAKLREKTLALQKHYDALTADATAPSR